MTKRELFSVCGRLTGHYPLGGWLRVACSFMKRQASDCDWDEEIPSCVKEMLREIKAMLAKEDPVGGVWSVSHTDEGVIWCDASSLAVGVIVEIDKVMVEDGCWLRKDDGNHINRPVQFTNFWILDSFVFSGQKLRFDSFRFFSTIKNHTTRFNSILYSDQKSRFNSGFVLYQVG